MRRPQMMFWVAVACTAAAGSAAPAEIYEAPRDVRQAAEACFTVKPQVKKASGQLDIRFAVSAPTDVEVAILDARGAGDKVKNVHLADEKHNYGPSKRKAAYRFLAEHLDLDIKRILDCDGKIDESFVTMESWRQLRVFGFNQPYPEDAVPPNTPLP